jgi:serine/threonine protein kinase/tetratricopeptide (TPR) repeat protein
MIGRTVSHYRVVGRLGGGGMGVVYKAEDIKLGRPVALKFLPEHLSRDEEALERLRREARAASALNHPNICTIYDIDEFEGQPFIVMEFMKGENLKQRLARGLFQVDELLEMASQLAGALDAAHASGILHRDLKPANIFITGGGQPKILDFGLAKLLSGRKAHDPFLSGLPTGDYLTNPGATLGTIGYMSPEQARGEELDARSDLFSLGAVFYEMATGRMAFGGDTSAIIFDGILNRIPAAPVQLNPEVPEKFQEIINKLLDKDRTLRYQSAADLVADLRRLRRVTDLSNPSITELRSAPSINASRPQPGWRRARVLVPISAIALIAVIGAMLFLRRARPPLTERDYILLEDFVNTTGDAAFDETLKQALAVQLEQSPYLNVFPDNRVRQTLSYMARPANERITDSVAREICQREAIKAILGGSITAVGSHYVITVEAGNCATGESLARDQREADSKEHVLTELGKAASSLRGKLGESLASIQKFDTPIETATTKSMEALKAYTQARAENGAGGFRQAVFYAQRAVELDPNFAAGYTALATFYNNLGQTQLARENATKAYQMRDRVSELERLRITARYYETALGDVNKAIETYEILRQSFPKDTTARNNLGIRYQDVGRFSDALTELQEGARLDTHSSLIRTNLGSAFAQINRFEEAKAIFKAAMDQKLDTLGIHLLLHDIAFAEGNSQAMQRELEWAKHKPGEDAMLFLQAEASASSGRIRDAAAYFRQAMDISQTDGIPEAKAGILSSQAGIEALVGNTQQAVKPAAEALKLGRFPRSYDSLGVAPAITLGLTGQSQIVNSWVDEMKKDYPQHTFINSVWIPSALAALQIRGGDGAKAVALLKPAGAYEPGPYSLVSSYLRGLAFLQMKSGREAAAEFQKILDHPGVGISSIFHPLSHLGLGRANALAGDSSKARQSYQDFFAIWKNADPDTPLLVQARQEYSKLETAH